VAARVREIDLVALRGAARRADACARHELPRRARALHTARGSRAALEDHAQLAGRARTEAGAVARAGRGSARLRVDRPAATRAGRHGGARGRAAVVGAARGALARVAVRRRGRRALELGGWLGCGRGVHRRRGRRRAPGHAREPASDRHRSNLANRCNPGRWPASSRYGVPRGSRRVREAARAG
jgi:hypothetical protein